MKEVISENLLLLLPHLANIVLDAAMLIVPIYCIIKRPTVPAYVMLVGTLMGLPMAIFSAWFNLRGINANMPMEEITKYFGFLGGISLIGSILFGCGFLIFLQDALRKQVSI